MWKQKEKHWKKLKNHGSKPKIIRGLEESYYIFSSTKANLEARVLAENGACTGKKAIAVKAKELGYDAIHDTVHEMCKDESRHGLAFQGLLNRFFK